MFKISDWAGNILDINGRFLRPSIVIPMPFATFEEGWAWIRENVPDEDNAHDDVEVVRCDAA